MASPRTAPDADAAPAATALLRRPELWLAGAAFLASGGAGLVYQVAWQRILALQSGVGIYSVAMIVAVFMAGLGIGSHLGGTWSLKLDALGALRRFVLVELGIGLMGALSCAVYYDLLYRRALWIYDEPWRAALMHVVALLPPTVLMGMSLPLLARAMVADARTAGRVIGFLYAVNLLGASVGSLLTPWVLVRHFGIRGATYVAAAANLFTALAGLAATLLLRRRAAVREEEMTVPAPAGDPDAPGGRPLSLWIGLYAASGFCALALELIWFRLLDVAVKSKAQTLGTLLSLYLLGCAVGCLAGIWAVPRLRRPLRAFLLCQTGLLAYAGLMVVLLAFLPNDAPLLDRLHAYWSRGSYHTRHRLMLLLYGELPLLLFGPATALMGLSFPILHRAVQDDPRTSGRKVGLLQAANIVGCVAGSLLVGLVMLRLVGTTGALRLLMLAGVAFAVVGRRAGGGRVFVEMGALLALLAVFIPGPQRLWMRLHGTEQPQSLLREDESGVAALVPRMKAWIVFVDGKSHSWLPFGGVHTQLGATPAIVHPQPLDVAIIGLGSGDTAWASLCRPETRSLDVFEISSGQPRLLSRLAALEGEPLPDLRAFLGDPRLRVQHADGRHALARSRKLYDVIEADALWPDVSYAGNLYSREFFQLLSERLKPGGLVCTWAPTPRVYASFVPSFRYVLGPSSRTILIGSNDPIEGDLEQWRSRLGSEPVRRYLGKVRVETVENLLRALQPLNRGGRRFRSRAMNLDLFPRDEFDVPQNDAP